MCEVSLGIILGGDSERLAHFSVKNLIEIGLTREKSHKNVLQQRNLFKILAKN